MTATGRISQDLPAIKQLIEQSGAQPPLRREPWWGEPCSEDLIRALADEYGELPQDVIDFYRVTNIATFGRFDDIHDPQVTIERREYFGQWFNEDAQSDYPFLFEEGLPQGDTILVMSGSSDWGCLIELGGPDHGRVINPPFNGTHFRTLAWSLSDAVACIRDLYEFGWYQWTNGFAGSTMTPGGQPTEEGLAELAKVQSILDRWNCNPVIAMFHDPYGYEPKRPTRN